MEPRYDEGPKNWQNLFAITNISRFLFHLLNTTNYWGKDNHSLYPKRLEVHFIDVPLCFHFYHFDSVKNILAYCLKRLNEKTICEESHLQLLLKV